MLKKLRRETEIRIEFPTSHYYIMRVYVIEQCYAGSGSSSYSYGPSLEGMGPTQSYIFGLKRSIIHLS
jgi:hypothetical protein